jgi:hypothetical protein
VSFSTAPLIFKIAKRISLLIFDLVLKLDVATVLLPARNLAIARCELLLEHYWLKASCGRR